MTQTSSAIWITHRTAGQVVGMENRHQSCATQKTNNDRNDLRETSLTPRAVMLAAAVVSVLSSWAPASSHGSVLTDVNGEVGSHVQALFTIIPRSAE